MDKKIKLYLSTGIFIIGTLFNLVFTTNLHYLLKGEIRNVQWFSFSKIFISMINNKEHLLLFLAFDGMILLGAIFYLLGKCYFPNK